MCHGRQHVPNIACVSLGPHSGTLQFNALVINGRPAALVKWAIEHLQIGSASGKMVHSTVWQILEAVNVHVGTWLFFQPGGADPGGGSASGRGSHGGTML